MNFTTNTKSFEYINDLIKNTNSYINYYKYTYQLRVFDEILLLVFIFTFLYYENKVRTLEKFITVMYENYNEMMSSSTYNDQNDNDDSIFIIQNNIKKVNKKLTSLKHKLQKDININNNSFKQKLKDVQNKYNIINDKYSSLEIMIDELHDKNNSVYDSDSDYELEDKTYNSIYIKNYSEKSFAVCGDTIKFKEQLKTLGGKWCPKLLGGPGWIFSNKHREKVDKWFMDYFDENNSLDVVNLS